MRANAIFVTLRWGGLLGCLFLTLPSPAQDHTSNATCAFDDGKEVSLRFTSSGHPSEHLHNGKIWTPADAPMYLFTQTKLKSGDLSVPEGAYSLYVIPEKKNWTLIVNKKVDAAAYDEKEDLGRVTMEIGDLGQAVESPQLALGHAGPKQCNLRINFEKVGAWGEFHEE